MKRIYPILRWRIGCDLRNPRWSWNGIAALQIIEGNICVKCTAVCPTYFRTKESGTKLSLFPSKGVTTSSWNDVRPCHIVPGMNIIHTTIITHNAVVIWYKYTNCCCCCCWVTPLRAVDVDVDVDVDGNNSFEIMMKRG
jgi:hypothetical protein